MPVYHLHASVITKGKQGSSAAFHQYLTREGREQASQAHRYVNREYEHGPGKDDLVAAGHANLPRWARDDPARFWQAADTFERPGWVVARHLEIALPRELSPEGRLALAQDLCAVTVGQFAYSWAIHEPEARDHSGPMPHVHILFSPRREDVELDRTPAQWFAKAAAHGQDPLRGGVRKDAAVEKKAWLYDVRAAVALLTNAALAREGLSLAVDHRTLEAQGLSRDVARYQAGESPEAREDQARTNDYRQHLRDSGTTAYEQLHRYAGWQDQAVKLLSVDRSYIRDLARDHVWRYDRAPARQVERQQSLQRTLSFAMGDRQPTQERTPQRTRSPHRDLRQMLQQLQQLTHRLGQGDEVAVGGPGLRLHLHDRERERDQGMSW